MTMRRMEIYVSFKDKQGKSRSRNVGAAFERDDGTWSLAIDPGISIHTGDGVFAGLRPPFDRNGSDRGNAGENEGAPF